jgi:hypothetical protein
MKELERKMALVYFFGAVDKMQDGVRNSVYGAYKISQFAVKGGHLFSRLAVKSQTKDHLQK